MKATAAATILRYMTDPRYAAITKSAANGDLSALNILFNATGHKNPSIQDYDDLQKLAGLFGTVIDDTSSTGGKSIDWSNKDTVDRLRKEASGMEQLLNGDPKTRAIKAGIQLVGDAARMGGNMAANNGNRLAAALIAANRTNSARQNDIYGPSRKEKATEAWGQDKIRRGNNWKIAGDTVGNFVDKVLGTYNMNAATAANAELTRQLAQEGLSSGAFEQLGKGVTAAKTILK